MIRIKHAAHSPVFLIHDSGAVRMLGAEEAEHRDEASLLTTSDEKEYNRLVCASYAAMGITPPKHNADGV